MTLQPKRHCHIGRITGFDFIHNFRHLFKSPSYRKEESFVGIVPSDIGLLNNFTVQKSPNYQF